MEKLKEQATTEQMKAKKDAKMIQLTDERDWFRSEALKLKMHNKKMTETLDRVKNKLATVVEERDFFLR